MKTRNEKTSAKVASTAGRYLDITGPEILAPLGITCSHPRCEMCRARLRYASKIAKEMRMVAASALTQTPERKR